MTGQQTVPAGWYTMQGDPPNTQRWWDGVQWTGEPRLIEAVAAPVAAQPAAVAPQESAVDYGSMLSNDLASYWDSMDEKVEPIAQFAEDSRAGDDEMENPDGPDQPDGEGGYLTPAFTTSGSGEGSISPLAWMFLPYKNFAQFKGRSCRAEYWWFALMQTLVVVGLLAGAVVFAAPSETGEAGMVSMAMMSTMFLFIVISAIPAWALTIRRLHDTGRSGWALLFPGMIPFIGSFILLAYYLTPGNSGWNKYGNEHFMPT